jgi:hypothetical protein
MTNATGQASRGPAQDSSGLVLQSSSAGPVPMTRIQAIQLWSGGKDSAMALWTSRQEGEVEGHLRARAIPEHQPGGSDTDPEVEGHGLRTRGKALVSGVRTGVNWAVSGRR